MNSTTWKTYAMIDLGREIQAPFTSILDNFIIL